MPSLARTLAGCVSALALTLLTAGCLPELDPPAVAGVAKTVQTLADRPYPKARLRRIVRAAPLAPTDWGTGFRAVPGAADLPLFTENRRDQKCRPIVRRLNPKLAEGYKRRVHRAGDRPVAAWTSLLARADLVAARDQLASAREGTRKCPDVRFGGSAFLGERSTPMVTPAGVDELHAVEGTVQLPGLKKHPYVSVVLRRGRFVGMVWVQAWEIGLARAQAAAALPKLVARLDRQLNG